MFTFQPAQYGPECAQLLTGAAPPPLGPGPANERVFGRLQQLSEHDLADEPIVDAQMARCCLAGLWLLHGFLDESHRLSQEIHTATGSFWHGIMHRREPDFANSKYWFRKVGQHPIFPQLCQHTQPLAAGHTAREANDLARQQEWDAMSFVDLCQRAYGREDALESLCISVAELEWQLLFDFCYQQMLGRAA